MSTAYAAILRAMSDRVESARAVTADVARRMNDVLDAACDQHRYGEHDSRALEDLREELFDAKERLLQALTRYHLVAEAHLSGSSATVLLAMACGFDGDLDPAAITEAERKLLRTAVTVAPDNDNKQEVAE